MESEFNDTQLLIKKTLRDYLEREIEPRVADMEDGKLLCYEPIRQMMGDLGLGDEAGEFSALLAESSPEDHLGLFLPRILPIEIARVYGDRRRYHGDPGADGGSMALRALRALKREPAILMATIQCEAPYPAGSPLPYPLLDLCS
jgi:hypothetical protein